MRDEKTYSQQFLTPSTVEGIRQKLGVTAILRHRLSHSGFALHQEQVQAPAFKLNGRTGMAERATSIIQRGVLLEPVLHLAFSTSEDADTAATQHLCLCRNEDVLFPSPLNEALVVTVSEEEWNMIAGFELLFGREEDVFLVGYNRFTGGEPMYGRLTISSQPTVSPSS
ncbi:MAG: hypothetical protein ACREL7_15955 [Longimicrobiales bacterium]